MVDQASLKSINSLPGNGAPFRNNKVVDPRSSATSSDHAANTMVGNVAGFGENLLVLAELQTRLAVLELRQNVQSASAAGWLGLAGALLIIASAPVVLVGIAELLVSELSMKRGHALLSVGAAAIVGGGLLVTVAVSWLRRKRIGFHLSGEEFTRNLNWVRSVLSYSGRSPAKRSP